MKEFKGEISRRELLKMASPLGKVTLERDRCTGCGLCALDCPSGALTASTASESDAYQLLFQHSLCVACSKCVEICPEHCLHLERGFELDEIKRPATVLFEDEIIRCPECGVPFASRAMINSIKGKIPSAGQIHSSQFELCPDCKTKALYIQVGK